MSIAGLCVRHSSTAASTPSASVVQQKENAVKVGIELMERAIQLLLNGVHHSTLVIVAPRQTSILDQSHHRAQIASIAVSESSP